MATLETFYGGSEYLSTLLAGITLSKGNKRLIDSVIPFNEHMSVLNEDGTITLTNNGFTLDCDGGVNKNCTIESSFNNSFRDIEWRATYNGTLGNSTAGASNYVAWGIELEDASGNIFAIRFWDNDNGTKRQIIADRGDPLTNEIASFNADQQIITFLIRRESGVFRAFYNLGAGGFKELAFDDVISGEIVSFRIKSRAESTAAPGLVTVTNIFLTCDGNAVDINLYDPAGLPTGEPYHLIMNGGPGSRTVKDDLGATIATLDGREGVILAIVKKNGVNIWVGKRVNIVGERDSLIIQFTEIPLLISEGIPFTITFCAFDSKGAVSSIYDGALSELVLKFTFSNDVLTVDDTIVDGCSTNVITDETLPYVQLAELETSGIQGFCWGDSFGSAIEDLPFPWSDFGEESEQQSTGLTGTEPFDTRWTDTSSTSGSATGSRSISSGALIFTGNSIFPDFADNAVNFNGTFVFNQSVAIEATVNALNDVNQVGPGNHNNGGLIGLDLGALGTFFELKNDDANPVPPAFNGTTGLWQIISTVGGAGFYEIEDASASAGTDFTLRIEYDADAGKINFYLNGNLVRSEAQAASTVTKLRLGGTTQGTTADFNYRFKDVKIQVKDHIGTWVNYWSPNFDRWTDNNSVGEAYQIVNPNSNKLEHIIPASSGTDTIRTENLFSGGVSGNITDSTWKVITNFSDMAFAGSAIETCMVEVENVALDTMQIGWRDNGTGGQKFFVNINAVEELAEADATSTGIATIERGDFTLSDFGGSVGFSDQKSVQSENGVFNSRFDTKGTLGAGGNSSISSDVLTMNLNTGAGTNRLSYQSTVSETGDYSINFDFSNYTRTGANALSTFAQILITVGGTVIEMGRITTDSLGDGFESFDGSSATSVASAVLSGKLRIRRVGSTTFFDYDNSGVWTNLASSGSLNGTLTLIGMRVQGSNNNAFSCDFNNYIVNASGVELTEKRVLFSNDEGLKFAFDDSNSPVTNIDIITSTTLTTAFNCTYQDIDIQAPTGTPYCDPGSVTNTIIGPNLIAEGFLPVQNLSTALELIPVRIWRELWQGLIINDVADGFYRWQKGLIGSTGAAQNDDEFLTFQSENSDQDSLVHQSPNYGTEDFAIITGVANDWQVLNDPAANLTVDAKMEIAASLELARERFLDSGNTWNILSFNESGLTLPKFLDEFFFKDESRFTILRFSDVTYIIGEGSLMAISNTLTNDSIANATLTFINTAAGILEGKFGAYRPIRTSQFTGLILWDIPAGVYPFELMNFFIDTLNNFNTENLTITAQDFDGDTVLLNGETSLEFVIGDNREYKAWVDNAFISEYETDTIVSNQGTVSEVLFNQFDFSLPAMTFASLFRRAVWNTKRMAPGVDFTQTVTINAFSLLANNQEAYLLVTDSKKILTGNIINRIGIRFVAGVLEVFSDDNGVITTSAFGGTEVDLKIDLTGDTISLEFDTGGGFSVLDTSTALDDKPLYFAFVVTNTNAVSPMSANIDSLKLINKSLGSGIGINTDIRLDFDMTKVLSYELYQAETTDPAPFITFKVVVPFEEIINDTARSVMLEPDEFYSWIEANRAVYDDAAFAQAVPGDTIQELHSLSVDSGFPYGIKPLWRKDFDVVKYAQALGTKRPDFIAFIFNGKNTIDYDPSTNDSLEDTGGQDDRFLHDGSDFWIGAIFQSLGTGIEQAIIDNSRFVNTNIGVSLYIDGTAKTIKFRIRNGSTSFDHDTPAGVYDETIANLIEVEQKGITNIIRINGIIVSSLDITSFTPSTAASSFNLTIANKGSSGTGSGFEGYLPIVMISRRRVDSNKAAYLRNYMWTQTGVLSTWITSPASIYNKETFNIVLRFPQFLAGGVVLLQAFDVNDTLLRILDINEKSFNIPFFIFTDDFNTIDALNTDIWTNESGGGVTAPFIFNNLVLRQALVSQNLLAKTVSNAPDRDGEFYIEAFNTVTFPTTPADDVRSMLVVEFGATTYRMGYLKDSGGNLFFKITEVGVGDIVSTALSDFINTPLIIKRDDEENLEFIFNSVTEHTIPSSTATLTKRYIETEGDTSNNITTDWDYFRYKNESAGDDITEVQDVNENIDILIDYQQDDDFLEIRSTIQETEITNRVRALILFYSERFIDSTINTRRLVISNAGNGSFVQDNGGTWNWTGSNGTDTSELKTTVSDAVLDGDFDIEFKVNIKAFPTGTANGSVLEFLISGASDDAYLRFYNVDSHATFGTFAGIKIFDNLNAPGDETITLTFEVLGEYTVKLSRRSGVCTWSFKTGVLPYQFIIDAGDLTTETLVDILRTTSLLNSSSLIDIDIQFTDINKEKNGDFFLV